MKFKVRAVLDVVVVLVAVVKVTEMLLLAVSCTRLQLL